MEVSAKTREQAAMLAGRLQKRKKHLAKWARREGVSVFRLYDRDIPEVPLVLDYYEGLCGGTPASALFGAVYKRPYTKDAAEETAWIAAMSAAAAETLCLDTANIFIKERKRIRPEEQYRNAHSERRFVMDVYEGAKLCTGGLHFRVNLSDYIDTGLYHDARKVRALLYHEAKGKSVLNLFCYTGAFSVYAAAAGAVQVDSVDLSAVYLERAAVNFTLNGLKPGGAFRMIRDDVLDFLENAHRRWDIIILNPPVFSNSKKTRRDIDLKQDYSELIRSCLGLLNSHGKLYFGAKLRGLAFDKESAAFRQDFPHIDIEDITEKIRCEDFKNRRIPVWWTFLNRK